MKAGDPKNFLARANEGQPKRIHIAETAACLLVALAARFPAEGASAVSSVPEPVSSWSIEVVAQAPLVKHPSVVACAPDGRVFVAEDPMDISLPNADAAEGRILCLGTNGAATVFAEKLHAVFGLQYLEGKLYVLHNPYFSVFDDEDGVGRNRRELIERTLPEPSALNWNDHVPANFHLAMDGCFYAASGDKGLYEAQGADGSRASLSSGGIFRIRPDGSRLEVMSHGARNILDVALNAEDEQFTYDNTDEHDWMGRFSHMVEAGFYGYPHDFIPRRPYTLWMMEDYGPGAACGVFAYTEDALPPEFHDNVFLSDFGKRQIMRVRLARQGATYRAVSSEDLFLNPPGDFRPVGIAPGPDGKSIYICDWQHRDEKEKISVGRLFKLTWTGPDHAADKPAWYLPAAMGRKFEAASGELARGLSHPSRAVRLTAQRRLAERAATKELLAVLGGTSAGGLARAHALWALDAIDEGESSRAEIIDASDDADPIVRRQAIRQLGGRRATGAVFSLLDHLKDTDASVRFQTATALGRIGVAGAVAGLLPALVDPDFFTRYAVFTALNRIGTNTPSTWPAITQGLESGDARVREGTVYALRETYDTSLLGALANLFGDTMKPVSARRAALELIASLHHRKPAWKGQWGAYHPALQPEPPRTERWPGTDLVLLTLRDGLQESNAMLRRICVEGLAIARDTHSAAALRGIFPGETDPATRSVILRALGAMKDSASLALITEELNHPVQPEITAAAIAAAREIGGDAAIQALCEFVGSSKADPSALAAAVRALGELPARPAAAAIEPLTRHPEASVRAASFTALGQLRGEELLPSLEMGLVDSALEVRSAVVKALGDLKSTRAVPALLKAYTEESLRAGAFRALARTPDQRAIDILLEGLCSRNPSERNAARRAIQDLKSKVLKRVEAKANALPPQALTELREIYAGNKLAESGPLFARQITQRTLDEYMDAAMNLAGNPQRGRKLFAEPGGLNCAACHRVAGEGSDLGPDLTGAGAQFDKRALAEAILYPSKAVREGYQQITIEMADDEEFSGVVKGESAETLILRDSLGQEHKLARALIKSRRNSALSLMPENLQAALSLQDFADLIAYLASLKNKPQDTRPMP